MLFDDADCAADWGFHNDDLLWLMRQINMHVYAPAFGRRVLNHFCFGFPNGYQEGEEPLPYQVVSSAN